MENALYAVIGLITGYFVGIRTNYIVGRVFEYRAFLHQAMIEVRLMSENLNSASPDLTKVPRVDSVVRLCADQLEYLDQRKAADVLRELERAIAMKLEEASRSSTQVRFRSEKEAWVRKLEDLRPERLGFFRVRKPR